MRNTFLDKKDGKTILMKKTILGFCITKAIIHHHIEFAFFSGTGCILWYVTLNLLLACMPKKQ